VFRGIIKTLAGMLHPSLPLQDHLDGVVGDEGALCFAEHSCVPDAKLVPTSLVFPF
jgi:hypothetical protein